MRTRFSSKALLAALAVLTLTLPLSGCVLSQFKAVKETKRLYYTYVNAPVEVKLDDPKSLSEAQSRLVSRLIPVDAQLTALERNLMSLGGNADQAMMESLLRRFPWLSGAVIMDSAGAVVATAPPVPMKNLDFAPLMTPDPRSAPRDLRVSVQDTPLGPEMILARPFYNAQDMTGMLAVTFDFNGLMSQADFAESLAVRSTDIALWTGSGYSEGALAGMDWTEELRRRSYGEGGGHSWLVRYTGFTPLIFASSASSGVGDDRIDGR